MAIRAFPYKWTCLVGLMFLASTLWADIVLDSLGILFVAVSIFCLFASAIASIVLAVIHRSRSSLYRVLLNVVVCLLFFPTIRLGDSLRDRLFLMRLARFQEVTNLLIGNEAAKVNHEAYVTAARLPPGYSNLHVADMVLINFTKENITVRYITRDSSALGHRGYMYRSDDDPAALTKDFPKLGYTRIAPHWFFFSD
jgi:hypothetical protein